MKKTINLYPVNLLKSNFEMKGGLKKLEIYLINKWKKINIYKKLLKNKKFFILHDGPPYANGNIHLGHIVNKVLKDIIIKFKIIYGFKVPFVLGWDCYGMSIENKMDEKYKNFYNILKLEDKFKKYIKKNILIQKKDFKKLGLFTQYENYYSTIKNKNISEEIRLLKNFQKKNFLYKNFKPVYWCFKCKINLSKTETKYNNKIDISIILIFLFLDIKKILNLFKINKKYIIGGITIWTTTPWSIISNQALCIDKELIYSIINTKKGFIIINYKLSKIFLKKNYIKGYIINIIPGNNLINIKFLNPLFNLNLFFNRFSNIYNGINLVKNIGTGIIHISPCYGVEDYLLYKKYKSKNINILDIISNKGKIYNNVPIFGGYSIWKLNKKILKILFINNKILNISKYNHKYMYCIKHKELLIYKTINQWFIKLNYKLNNRINLKKSFNSIINKIKFIPKISKKRFLKTLINRPDWNISRQRNWGIPISLIIHKKNNIIHNNINKLLEVISNYIEIYGIKYWKLLDLRDLMGNLSVFYKKLYDILDVWFDSGTTHWHVLRGSHKNFLKFPADIYLEGSDQHRGWFQSSLITSYILNKKLPYKTIITHGFVINEKGEKLSKSLNNYINYNNIVKFLEIDVIRLWICSLNYTKNIFISKKILNEIIDLYRKIRNCIRFLLTNISDLNNNSLIKNNLCKLDIFFLNYCIKIYKEIIFLYKNYKFNFILFKIKNFLSEDLSGGYFSIIKDKLYINKLNSKSRKSIQITLYYILINFLKLLASILPFTSEESWSNIFYNNSIFLNNFLSYKLKKNYDKNWLKIKNIYIKINKFIEKLKYKKLISSSLDIVLVLYINYDIFKDIKKIKNELKFIFIVSKVKLNINFFLKEIKFLIKISKKKKCIRCWRKKINLKKNLKVKKICKNCFITLFKQNIK